MNQLWWIGPVLLLLGYGSRGLAKRRRSAAPRGNPEAVSEPRAAGAVPDRPLLFISVRPSADEDNPALQAMGVDGHSIGLFGPGFGGTWSPDARRFAFVAEVGLVVATLEGQPDVVVATGENESLVSWPMWAPTAKSSLRFSTPIRTTTTSRSRAR